jgi:hypothetical protein
VLLLEVLLDEDERLAFVLLELLLTLASVELDELLLDELLLLESCPGVSGLWKAST